MVLRIDPRLPVVWRTPFELQIGSDRAVVTLKEITQPEEYLLAVFRKGISRSGLDMIGSSAGATLEQTAALLERVTPALTDDSAERSLVGRTIVVTGRGAGADGIRLLLVELGATVSSAAGDANAVDLAVLVAHPSPSTRRSRGTGFAATCRIWPSSSVIPPPGSAPLVEPGHGPCLHCVERARLDRDPSWAAIAGQLLDRSAATESALTVAEVVALAARAILDRLAPGAGAEFLGARLRRRAIVVDGESGALSELRFRLHPECACHQLPRQGIGTAPGRSSDPAPIESTTAPAVSARA